MRRDLTDAERKLWWALRHDLVLTGTHFRRQVPIGPYIADFLCLSARLIVEVDGEQHGFESAQAHDAARAAYLEAQGFQILRFWNRQVLTETRSVVDTIFATLNERASPPTPAPSPRGGGERRGAWSTGEI